MIKRILLPAFIAALTACTGPGLSVTSWDQLPEIEKHMANTLDCIWRDKELNGYNARICMPTQVKEDASWIKNAYAAYHTGKGGGDGDTPMTRAPYRRGVWLAYERMTKEQLESIVSVFGFMPEAITPVISAQRDSVVSQVFELKDYAVVNFVDRARSRDMKTYVVRLRHFEAD